MGAVRRSPTLTPVDRRPEIKRALDHAAGHVRIAGGRHVGAFAQISAIGGADARGQLRRDFAVAEPRDAVGAEQMARPHVAPDETRGEHGAVFNTFMRPNFDVRMHDRGMAHAAIIAEDRAFADLRLIGDLRARADHRLLQARVRPHLTSSHSTQPVSSEPSLIITRVPENAIRERHARRRCGNFPR